MTTPISTGHDTLTGLDKPTMSSTNQYSEMIKNVSSDQNQNIAGDTVQVPENKTEDLKSENSKLVSLNETYDLEERSIWNLPPSQQTKDANDCSNESTDVEEPYPADLIELDSSREECCRSLQQEFEEANISFEAGSNKTINVEKPVGIDSSKEVLTQTEQNNLNTKDYKSSEKKLSMVDQMNSTVVIENNLNRTVNLDDSMGYNSFKDTDVVETTLSTTITLQGQQTSEKKLSMVEQINSTVVIENNLNRTVNLGYNSSKEMDNTNVVETKLDTFSPQGQQTFEEVNQMNTTSVVESKLDTTFNLQEQAEFKTSDETSSANQEMNVFASIFNKHEVDSTNKESTLNKTVDCETTQYMVLPENTFVCIDLTLNKTDEIPIPNNNMQNEAEQPTVHEPAEIENNNSEQMPEQVQADVKTIENTLDNANLHISYEIIPAEENSQNSDENPQELTEIEPFEQETDSFDDTETDIASRDVQGPIFVISESAIERRRFKLDNVLPYSPSHLALAAAFENLNINSTVDETFLSCNQSELSLVDEVIEVSSDDEFETTASIEKSITEPHENMVVCKDEHFVESVEEELDILNTAAAEVCPNDCKTTIIVEDMVSDILTETENSNKPEFLNDTEPTSNRKSTGIIMSTMTFGMPPSPGKQNLSAFGNELYAELLAASPAVYDQKVADYDKYVALKLEINDLQQTIAKLTIELKQKEAQILALQPHKVNLPVRKASEDSKSLELERALKTITILQAENDMYLDEVKQLKELLFEENEQNNNAELQEKCEQLQAEVDRSRDEIADVRKQNEILKKNLESVDELLISYRAKMGESEDVYKKKVTKVTTTLDHVLEKYEKNRNELVNMQKTLTHLQSTYFNLQCDYKTLCLSYEAFKKSASERIAEANKENLKIKLEADSKGAVAKRPPLRDN